MCSILIYFFNYDTSHPKNFQIVNNEPPMTSIFKLIGISRYIIYFHKFSIENYREIAHRQKQLQPANKTKQQGLKNTSDTTNFC